MPSFKNKINNSDSPNNKATSNRLLSSNTNNSNNMGKGIKTKDSISKGISNTINKLLLINKLTNKHRGREHTTRALSSNLLKIKEPMNNSNMVKTKTLINMVTPTNTEIIMIHLIFLIK